MKVTASRQTGAPVAVGLVLAITAGALAGGLSGLVTSLPSGSAVAFVLPGILLGAVSGAVAVTAGMVGYCVARHRNANGTTLRTVATATAATVAATTVVVSLSWASIPNAIGISLFSLAASALIAYAAYPALVREAKKPPYIDTSS